MGSPEYDRKNTRRIDLKLNRKTDADVIEKLEDQPSMQAYIKHLIREDIRPPFGKLCSQCGKSQYNWFTVKTNDSGPIGDWQYCPGCGGKMV